MDDDQHYIYEVPLGKEKNSVSKLFFRDQIYSLWKMKNILESGLLLFLWNLIRLIIFPSLKHYFANVNKEEKISNLPLTFRLFLVFCPRFPILI